MQGVSQMALRYLFWVLLGFACLGFVKFGVITFFVIIAVLIALVLIGRRHTDVLGEALKSLAEGARHALPVAVACALVGVIIGIINRSEEHTSELQSRGHLVCRLLLEIK